MHDDGMIITMNRKHPARQSRHSTYVSRAWFDSHLKMLRQGAASSARPVRLNPSMPDESEFLSHLHPSPPELNPFQVEKRIGYFLHDTLCCCKKFVTQLTLVLLQEAWNTADAQVIHSCLFGRCLSAFFPICFI